MPSSVKRLNLKFVKTFKLVDTEPSIMLKVDSLELTVHDDYILKWVLARFQPTKVLLLNFGDSYDKMNLRSIGNMDVLNSVEAIVINTPHINEPFFKSLEKIERPKKYIIGVQIDLEKYKILARNFAKYLEKYPKPELMKELVPEYSEEYKREIQDLNEILKVPSEIKHFTNNFTRRDP